MWFVMQNVDQVIGLYCAGGH